MIHERRGNLQVEDYIADIKVLARAWIVSRVVVIIACSWLKELLDANL